jgi:copper oxidase (laccase) domain-containing protein
MKLKDKIPFETFAPLAALPFVRHAFSIRTGHDTRSDDFAGQFVRQLGYDRFAAAEQPHGDGVAVVKAAAPDGVPGVDALVTRQRGLPLVIRCADCPPVFLVDRRAPAIALVHSGKKGTRAGVVANALKHMDADFAFIGPSIGPCHYEVDLWTEIERQLAGVAEIHNPRICTACHLDRYFSYRAEKGDTGRMFAVLCLR